MNVLVTGATGFIGSHLVDRLCEKDYNVYAIIRHTPRNVKINKKVNVLTGDLLDIHGLKKAVSVSQPEVVIHTAALTPVRHSFENPFIFAKTNYIGTMNMVHAALDSPILKKFIHASTAETYDPHLGLIKETDELFGSTPYGVSKVAADFYVQVAGLSYGLPYIILRPSNTYGRKTETGYVIEKIITTMLKTDHLILNGTPDPKRDFMYVDDHVNGYIKALETKVKNEIFNISTARTISIGELVELASDVLNWKGVVSFEGKPRPNDPKSLVLDNSKAKRMMNWKPNIKLEDGLQKVAEYWGDKT